MSIIHFREFNELWIYLTLACNLRCIHCFTSSSPEVNTSRDPKLEDLLFLIDEAKKYNIKEIRLTGGEPFLKLRELFRILEYANNLNLSSKIITNGTLINFEVVKKLSQIKNLVIQISLDGTCAETHDAIRGKGTFDLIIKNVKLLRESGVNVVLSMVLREDNKNELSKLSNLAKSLNCGYHIMLFFKSIGKARNTNFKTPRLTKVKISRFTPHCVTGITFIEGRFQPCPFLFEEKYSIGNSLKEALTQESFEKIRNFNKKEESCKICLSGIT